MVKPDVTGVKLTPKAFMASMNLPENEAARVTDGDVLTSWSSGALPPQWIQLDLGDKTSISEVLLNVDQFPDGPSTHEVYGGPAENSLKLLGTLKGDTKSNQWLELKVSAADVRFLKILTVESPSWVGWREIEVYK